MQTVLGGDFNCVLVPLDKTGGTSTERKKTVMNKIKNLCTNFDLQDVWRLQHPGVSQYTWRNNWLWLPIESVMIIGWFQKSGLFAWCGHMVQYHTCWNASCTVGFPKQRRAKVDW